MVYPPCTFVYAYCCCLLQHTGQLLAVGCRSVLKAVLFRAEPPAFQLVYVLNLPLYPIVCVVYCILSCRITLTSCVLTRFLKRERKKLLVVGATGYSKVCFLCDFGRVADGDDFYDIFYWMSAVSIGPCLVFLGSFCCGACVVCEVFCRR